MQKNQKRKIREQAELELIRNKPLRPINTNSQREVTNKEKIVLIISSKPFVIVASILTLGLYYAYYVFCLDEASRNPFSEFPDKHYEFLGPRKDLKAEEKKKEVNDFSRRLQKKFSSASKKGLLDRVYSKAFIISNRLLIGVCNLVGGLVTFFGSIFSRVTGTRINLDRVSEWKERLGRLNTEREKKFRKLLIEKLNLKIQVEDKEFVYGEVIQESLEIDSPNKPRDYYYAFLFWVSYVVVSILTLGVLPIRHFLNRGRNDLMKINDQKAVFDAYEFDILIARLIGLEETVEFSSVLSGDDFASSGSKACSDLFRTKFFKYGHLRKRTIISLVVGTLGVFGLLVAIESFRNKTPHLEGILEIDTRPTYKNDMKPADKLKSFCNDFLWDLKMAIRLASIKEFKIKNCSRFAVRSEDRLVSNFISFISSPLYVIFFTLFFVLSSLVTFCLVLFSSIALFSAFSFCLFFVLVCLFLGFFARHVSLLFS